MGFHLVNKNKEVATVISEVKGTSGISFTLKALEPGTTEIYVMWSYAAVGGNSTASYTYKYYRIKVMEGATAPVIASKTQTSVTLVATNGYEYSKDGTHWQTSNVFTGLLPGTEYMFCQRVAATAGNDASPISAGTSVTTYQKTNTNAPNAPTITSKTSVSVTLTKTSGYEYSINGTTWQTSNVFTELSPSTQYTFFQRVAETDTAFASPSSTGTSVFTEECKHTQKTLIPAKSSTCKEQGWDAYYKCDDCEQIFLSDGTTVVAEIPLRSLGNHKGGTATCKAKAVCKDCGIEYGDYAAHQLIKHDRVEPTFETDGNIEYWTCDECGKYFSDAEGKNEINAQDTVIGKLTIKKLTYLDGEVLIEVPSNAVSGEFEITVDKIVPPPAEIVEKVKDTYDESSEVLAYYEIRMFDENGDRIYILDNEITVKSKLPEKYQTGYEIKINQEDDDGNLVEMQSWREGEFICYKTNWLEKY